MGGMLQEWYFIIPIVTVLFQNWAKFSLQCGNPLVNHGRFQVEKYFNMNMFYVYGIRKEACKLK